MRKNSEKMVQVGCEEGEKCTSRISSVLQFPHAHQSYKCICGLIHVKLWLRFCILELSSMFTFVYWARI
uniref:Ovule protein n=1 Tax=Brugia timori TaxID=42155 RepID=A0A0R3QG45_9BILA